VPIREETPNDGVSVSHFGGSGRPSRSALDSLLLQRTRPPAEKGAAPLAAKSYTFGGACQGARLTMHRNKKKRANEERSALATVQVGGRQVL
jgi:hypothetical protein